MFRIVTVSALVLLGITCFAASNRMVFQVADGKIELQLGQTLIYNHEPLRFVNSGKSICLAGAAENQCPIFTGALRTVLIKVSGKSAKGATLRERVRQIDHSAGIAERAEFNKALPLQEGMATDIQAFGFDDATPGALGDFETCRQELFLGESTVPFAVLTWKRTLKSIEIVSSETPRTETAASR